MNVIGHALLMNGQRVHHIYSSHIHCVSASTNVEQHVTLITWLLYLSSSVLVWWEAGIMWTVSWWELRRSWVSIVKERSA